MVTATEAAAGDPHGRPINGIGGAAVGIRMRTTALALLLFGLALSGLARTASNTVPDTKAGDGQAVVSGYVVSTVHYVGNATDPTLLDSVTFDLDTAPPPGATIRARLATSGPFYACTNSGVAVTCDTTVGIQATAAGTDLLRVVVTS